MDTVPRSPLQEALPTTGREKLRHSQVWPCLSTPAAPLTSEFHPAWARSNSASANLTSRFPDLPSHKLFLSQYTQPHHALQYHQGPLTLCVCMCMHIVCLTFIVVLPACMAMHHVCLVPRAEKRVLEPLELQLLTVMKMAGDSILGPPKEQSGLLATEPSLHLLPLHCILHFLRI